MRSVSLTLAAVLFAAVSHAVPAGAQEEAELAFTWEAGADVVTHYVWHGFDLAEGGPLLQPSVTLSHRSGLWASAWGSLALTDRRRTLTTGELRREVDELDLFVGYTHEGDALEVEAAVMWYGYPNAAGFPDRETTSFEPYVTATLSAVPLSPSMTVRYDTNLGDGWSAEGAVEHADSLGAFEVTAGASLAWMRQAWRLTEAGEKEAGLSDFTASLGVGRSFGAFTVTPTVAWTRLLEGETTPGDDTVWGRLTVTYAP